MYTWKLSTSNQSVGETVKQLFAFFDSKQFYSKVMWLCLRHAKPSFEAAFTISSYQTTCSQHALYNERQWNSFVKKLQTTPRAHIGDAQQKLLMVHVNKWLLVGREQASLSSNNDYNESLTRMSDEEKNGLVDL